jgi:hypothetical protein
MSTAFHARYFAHALTLRRPATSSDRLSASLFDASVDLNPHQIDAALFALQSPLSKGAVLADEVGLGKTIEAGLVLCQYWAERRRRLLVICPASLRKQWALELEEKFNLPTLILDSTSHNHARRNGNAEPFNNDRLVITSINFASAMQNDVRAVAWDLVVIDEAHKLRNAYRPSNKMGQRLRWALEDRRKLLLTATPLQNSLLELYGLSTLIDDHIFGDVSSFRTQYMRQDTDLRDLQVRLKDFCKRTLRNDVVEYIQYTERRALTRPFRPTDDEHKLYEAVSAFLLRDDTYSIPRRQRTLTTLILRKLLASSSVAIAGTLETMRKRLERLRDGLQIDPTFPELLAGLEELETDIVDEIDQEQESDVAEPAIDRVKLDAEIVELDRFAVWARSIGVDTKSRSLLVALETGFSEMVRMGAARKALIFTESRRTQEYLRAFLDMNGYAGKLVLFNGSNSDPESRAIYEQWLEINRETGRSTGSRVIDMRTALIEHFRDTAQIMIATEAAAEGVNLQFCSLVVNYDLPWNPQRIEQRIGRCHRYGQKYDVVVINFLNERNEADRRILELLTEKFNLFSGVFGASDDVLGTIESGVDFEKRILAIYQQCRTTAEIDAAFRALQTEMDDSIRSRLTETRRKLLEHFDEDVHARFRLQLATAREHLDTVGRMFWILTRLMLHDHASFEDEELKFHLTTPPRPDLHIGCYHLISKTQANVPSEFLYRLSHPLGQYVLEAGKQYPTPSAEVQFDVSNHATHIAAVEELRGHAGWLILERLVIESFEREEYLLFSALDDHGKSVHHEVCDKFFRCEGEVKPAALMLTDVESRMDREAERHRLATIARSLESNNKFFLHERERLERWADDRVIGAERELADTKAQLKAANREARLATTLEQQHEIQTKIRELERQQRKQRQWIFDVEDEIKEQRDHLVEALERRLSQKTSHERLFGIRWSVV